MVISNAQVFTWMGFNAQAKRNAIIGDFLQEGYGALEFMSDEDVKDMYTSYAKRTDAPFPIICTSAQKQRLRSLVMWVKDMSRAGMDLSFEDGTTKQQFLDRINASMLRHQRRQKQMKIGESFHDADFNTKLKTQSQWEKFVEELESTLGMIIGAKGVPLTYVIREIDEPNYDDDLDYDEAIINAVDLNGEDYKIDTRTVHQLILRNVHEDSDAYTYIKPLLRKRDGRLDILALRDRYHNDATKQAIINSAKNTLSHLRYKNERSFPFEKFSARLQKAYDELEANGRMVNNGDIVDDLWARIQNTDIQVYVSSLKVDYQRNPRNYQLILQDIAAEIASKSSITFATNRNISATYTRQGPCPQQGVHKADGSLFIGNYSADQWRSESVKPYHNEIMKARSNDGGGNTDNGSSHSRSQKRRVNAIKRNKNKLKKLNQKIAAAKSVLEALPGKEEVTTKVAKVQFEDQNAGDAFGGKKSKSNKS